MSEDERQEMLRTVAEAHTGHRELAFRLGRELRLKAPVLKAAIRAEGVVFGLKRELQSSSISRTRNSPAGATRYPRSAAAARWSRWTGSGGKRRPNDVP